MLKIFDCFVQDSTFSLTMVTVAGEKYDREVSAFFPNLELLKELTVSRLSHPIPRMGEKLEIVCC